MGAMARMPTTVEVSRNPRFQMLLLLLCDCAVC
jgi:hypothetical protein